MTQYKHTFFPERIVFFAAGGPEAMQTPDQQEENKETQALPDAMDPDKAHKILVDAESGEEKDPEEDKQLAKLEAALDPSKDQNESAETFREKFERARAEAKTKIAEQMAKKLKGMLFFASFRTGIPGDQQDAMVDLLREQGGGPVAVSVTSEGNEFEYVVRLKKGDGHEIETKFSPDDFQLSPEESLALKINAVIERGRSIRDLDNDSGYNPGRQIYVRALRKLEDEFEKS